MLKYKVKNWSQGQILKNKIKSYPLSYSQKSIWLHSQLTGLNNDYNLAGQIKFTFEIEPNSLIEIFRDIINRHDQLRAVFYLKNSEPVQEIYPEAKIDFKMHNISGLSEKEIDKKINKKILLPFDLNLGPLIRFDLFSRSKKDHIFLICIHHIICDAWSLDLVLKEFYNKIIINNNKVANSGIAEYSDFVSYQEKMLSGSIGESHFKFWKNELGNKIDLSVFYNEKDIIHDHTVKTKSRIIKIPEKLFSIGNYTQFVILAALFKVFLYKYTGQKKIFTAIPMLNRTERKFRRTIGNFVNIVLLKLDIDKSLNFLDVLNTVKEKTVNAFKHQEYPLPLFAEKQRITANSEYPLLTNGFVSMTKISFPKSNKNQNGFSVKLLKQAYVFADLGFQFYRVNNRKYVELSYNKIIFSEEKMDRIINNIKVLADQISLNPNSKISNLSIISKEEKIILNGWNIRKKINKKTVITLFEEQVKRSSELTALKYRNESLSYREFNSKVNRLARLLVNTGVKKGTGIGVLLNRSPELLISMFAVLKAGCVFVPLSSELPEERIKYMIKISGAAAVICRAEISFLNGNIKKISPDSDNLDDYSPKNLNIKITGNDPAYIIFTSGTTGNPKGVLVEHKGMVNLSQAQKEYFNLKTDDKILQFSSSVFDAFIWEVIMAFLSGACLVLCDREIISSPYKLNEIINKEKISIATFPPAVLKRLPENNNSLIKIISAGEDCSVRTAEKWIKSGKDFFNAYGPTEATVCVSIAKINLKGKLPLKKLPIGKPINNMQAYILDENKNLLPIGSIGELYICGIGLAKGYINDKESEKKSFIKNPFNKKTMLYKTGDLARWTDNGELEFHGRIDRQVKLRGYRIEPDEIEQTILKSSLVKECVVNIKGREEAGEGIIIAFIVSEKNNFAIVKSLQESLKFKLPGYMIPSRFIFIDTVPLTQNNKIDYNCLDEIYNKETKDTANNLVHPRNPVEKALLKIWKDVLEIKNISIYDNFFSLGGHSLKMTRVLSRIRDYFDIEIPLREIFDLNTIADLAEYINNKKQKHTVIIPQPVKEKNKQKIPLSFSQERIWFIHNLEPESLAYNIILSVKITGKMNISVLKKAFKKVIDRHDILRTTFYQEDGIPFQKIHNQITDSFNIIDLDNFLHIDKKKEAYRYANEQAKYLFNLETGPLIRLSVIKYDYNQYILILNMHHIISDLWSTGNFANELSSIYYSLLLGKESVLPELSIQYSDYAFWQRKYLTDKKLSSEIEYWKNTLKGLPVLKLPQDKPRPLIQTYIGSYVSYKFDDELLEQLKILSINLNTSVFMILLSCFYILLHKYTGMDDIPVGTPVANRLYSSIEHQIGTFVNTIVLRALLKNNPDTLDFINNVKNISLEAFSHQNVPFERIVELINPDRDLSRLPLAQVLFNVANAPLTGNFLDNMDWDIYNLKETGVQFDLTLTIEPEITKQATFHYNTDLFEHSTIKQLGGHYVNILKEVLSNPYKKISDISMLTEEEFGYMVVDWNKTKSAYPDKKIFCELFEKTVLRNKKRTAVIFNNISLDYQELNKNSNSLARYLLKKGAEPEKIIAVYMDRSPELIISLLAVMKSGAAYLPLDLSYPEDRLNYMLLDSDARLLLTTDKYKNRLNFPHEKTVCINTVQDEINKLNNSNLSVTAKPENIVYVIYTSGSTGNPKGVQITHRNLINFLYSMKDKPGLDNSDNLLAVTPVSFDISCLELYLPLLTGAKIILADSDTSRDGRLLNKLIETSKPTIMQATPSTWQMLIETGWSINIKIKKILCGGEAISKNLASKLLSYCESLWNLYGPTETTVWSLVYRICNKDSPVLIGKPIANTSLYVLDQFMNPVPVGVYGELFIGGDGVARGYLNNNELTDKKFVKDIFSVRIDSKMYGTGDLVRYRKDGNLDFLGRTDFQVKLHGHRIELEEIDFWIQKYDGIEKSVTIISSKNLDEKRIVSYIIKDNNNDFAENRLFEFLKAKIPDFMVPSKLMVIDSFPLTPNNKLDIKSLPPPVWENTDDVEIIPPNDELERKVIDIWQEVLGVKEIGMKSNFFKYGGHSLLAVSLLYKIKEEFNIEIPLRYMFLAPTPEEFAELLRKQTFQKLNNIEIDENDILFIMQKGNNRLPLFLIVGVYADADGIYRHLSNIVPYLGLDQPAFGLRPRGLLKPEKPYKSITLMARDYVRQIKNVQPNGPYLLAGECIGGVVALEAAIQLTDQNESVALVMLLDTFYPAELRSLKFKVYFINRLINKIVMKFKSLLQKPVFLIPFKIRNFITKQKSKVFPETEKKINEQRFRQVEKYFYRISTLYKPKKYKGRIAILINEEDHKYSPYLGWRNYISGKNKSGQFETYIVPGNHMTRLTTYRKETGGRIRQLIGSSIK